MYPNLKQTTFEQLDEISVLVQKLTDELFEACLQFTVTHERTLLVKIQENAALLQACGYQPRFIPQQRLLILDSEAFELAVTAKKRADEWRRQLEQERLPS